MAARDSRSSVERPAHNTGASDSQSNAEQLDRQQHALMLRPATPMCDSLVAELEKTADEHPEGKAFVAYSQF